MTDLPKIDNKIPSSAENKTKNRKSMLDELERITVKAWLPKAKASAIATSDLEWLEELHKIERKYAETR